MGLYVVKGNIHFNLTLLVPLTSNSLSCGGIELWSVFDSGESEQSKHQVTNRLRNIQWS